MSVHVQCGHGGNHRFDPVAVHVCLDTAAAVRFHDADGDRVGHRVIWLGQKDSGLDAVGFPGLLPTSGFCEDSESHCAEEMQGGPKRPAARRR